MESHKINKISRFFAKSAGAYIPVLEKCPSQVTKYFSMGVILWITAMMASFSGGYFINTIFTNDDTSISWLVFVFALFWGLAIFSLDRYMVTSIDINKGFRKSLLQATPRLLLALCLGIVVSKPLEMKFFEKEINSEIQSLNQSEYKNKLERDSDLNINAQDIRSIELKEKQLDSTLVVENMTVEKLKIDYFNERNGKGISGKNGYGPQAKQKEKLWEDSKLKYEGLEKSILKEKEALNTKREELNNMSITIRQRIEAPLNSNDGPLKRIQALHSITKKDIALQITDMLLSLIFILFEVAPIMVKLSMKKGLYEIALENYEKEREDDFTKDLDYNRHVKEYDFKKKVSAFNGEIIYSEEVKNSMRESKKKLDLDVIKEYEKLDRKDLKDEKVIRQRINEIKNRVFKKNRK